MKYIFFQGQRTYLGPGLLHLMETLPCVKLDIPALFSNSARSPEEAITQLIHTARRTQPGVLYIPHLLKLWDTVSQYVIFMNVLYNYALFLHPGERNC